MTEPIGATGDTADEQPARIALRGVQLLKLEQLHSDPRVGAEARNPVAGIVGVQPSDPA
ncbi:MAG TPA: hypothetical protein VEF89_33825 [Solirubrobacteraceae bacterium]|nr:hypothetical protein [Solirubrobacteraceae bacterium]